MANIQILFDPKSDTAALSWGSWAAGLPLSNVQSRRLSRVARSSDLALISTRFRIALAQEEAFEAIVVGPMNVSREYRYRIALYSGADFGTETYSSGWIEPFIDTYGATELEWEDLWFWLGNATGRDTERDTVLIHRFGGTMRGRYWSIELDDVNNPDGHIDIGRLFMADAFEPRRNYAYENNGLSFRDNSMKAETLGGSRQFWRRANQRTFRFSLPYLSEEEGYGQAYDLMQVAGFDGEVFVIPDPSSNQALQKRSFFGTIAQMDALSQTAFEMVGTGFQIEESI